MGQIIQVRFEDMMPGELGFHPDKLETVLRNSSNSVPTLPIVVRRSSEKPGKIVQMDGRHRLLASKMRGLEGIAVYLAEHQEDYLDSKNFPEIPSYMVEETNRLISLRWIQADVIGAVYALGDYNKYFERLIGKYPYLENPQKFLETCNNQEAHTELRSAFESLFGTTMQ